MCGICGFVGIEQEGLLEEMTAALTHRGPDSAGYFRRGDVGLGHRRLSIIDVAAAVVRCANISKAGWRICGPQHTDLLSSRLRDDGSADSAWALLVQACLFFNRCQDDAIGPETPAYRSVDSSMGDPKGNRESTAKITVTVVCRRQPRIVYPPSSILRKSLETALEPNGITCRNGLSRASLL